MKLVIVVALLSIGFTKALAKEGKNFETRKAKVLERTDKKIAALNDFKTCVSAASEKAAMKACRKTKKEAMSGLKKKHKHGKHGH